MIKSTTIFLVLAIVIFFFFLLLAVRGARFTTWTDRIPTGTPTPEIGFPMEDFESPTASPSATLTVTVFPTGEVNIE